MPRLPSDAEAVWNNATERPDHEEQGGPPVARQPMQPGTENDRAQGDQESR